MHTDLDWVGRDLHRLASESKLTRMPTEAEWERIWVAATKWADAFGVVCVRMRIDEFVRASEPGALDGAAAVPATSSPPARANAVGR
jgi:hypothetical protein